MATLSPMRSMYVCVADASAAWVLVVWPTTNAVPAVTAKTAVAVSRLSFDTRSASPVVRTCFSGRYGVDDRRSPARELPQRQPVHRRRWGRVRCFALGYAAES